MIALLHLTATGRTLRYASGNPPVLDLPDGTRVTVKDVTKIEWCPKCHRQMGDHAFDCPVSNPETDGA